MEKLTGGEGSRVVVVGGEQCVQCATIFSILAARTASCAGSSDCYEPLERFIGIMEPRQDNGRQQRHISP